METYGPTLTISEEIHAMKYRSHGETFREAMTRVAEALKDSESTCRTCAISNGCTSSCNTVQLLCVYDN
jgi:hypothetical protein